jgi:hypothetical protein
MFTIEKIEAAAAPEKRLFISLITRDISLIDAFLDLIDNSINAIIAPMADNLQTAGDYVRILENYDKEVAAQITIRVNEHKIFINDNAAGISANVARDHVFKFGRSDREKDRSDRLSVYGIGLKRAMFKMGNRIKMTSDHAEGGFGMDLNVKSWARDPRQPWVIDLVPRAKAGPTNCGTTIEISDLFPDVVSRIKDGVFIDQLKRRISRTYTFFLNKIVRIDVNDDSIEGIPILISENRVVDSFQQGGVSCAISAGIAEPDARGRYIQEASGFYIFCNGRTVIFGDRSELTGWTGSPSLPLFQPKHRPFVGVVFFTAADPETLPWTTTKTAINQESGVWQEARRKMISAGRQVTGWLDNRYSGDGTEVSPADVRNAAGQTNNALAASASKKQNFRIPQKAPPKEIRIQYSALVEDIEKIAKYLRRPGMGGAEVGRYTFEYFLKNRVSE